MRAAPRASHFGVRSSRLTRNRGRSTVGRIVRRALLILLGGALLAACGSAVAVAATRGGKPPLSQADATLGGNLVQSAITHERKALAAIKRHRIVTALHEAHEGDSSLSAGVELLKRRDGGDDGAEAAHEGASAGDDGADP